MAEKKIPQGDKIKIKGILFIGNIIISALCILSILGYFIMPLWEVKVSVTLTPEIVEKFAPQDSGSSEGEEGSSGDMMSGILQSLAESNFKLELSGITLDTYSFVAAATGGTTEPVRKLIDSNIEGIMQSLSDTIDTAIAPLMKSVVVTVVKEEVKKAVKEALAEGENLDEKTKEALEEMNFNDEFIETNVSGIIDAITAEDATVDSVSGAIMDVYDNVITNLETSDTYGESFREMSQEDKDKAREEIQNALTEVLNQIAAEDGSIDVEELLSNLLLSALSSGEEGSGESGGEAYAYDYSSSVAYADDGESESAKEELKAKILAAVMEKLNDETISMTAEVMKYIGYVVLFTFFTWAYLILKILVKIGAKNPGIKLKLPMWLGYIPYTILVLLPTALIAAVKAGALESVMGEGAAELKIIFDAINISFTSGAVFSFISAIALFVFSFFYGHYRRKLKKIIKYEKKNGIA